VRQLDVVLEAEEREQAKVPEHTIHPDHEQAKVATRGKVEPVEAVLQSAASRRHKQCVSAISSFH
jgi:hypothetical protein